MLNELTYPHPPHVELPKIKNKELLLKSTNTRTRTRFVHWICKPRTLTNKSTSTTEAKRYSRSTNIRTAWIYTKKNWTQSYYFTFPEITWTNGIRHDRRSGAWSRTISQGIWAGASETTAACNTRSAVATSTRCTRIYTKHKPPNRQTSRSAKVPVQPTLFTDVLDENGQLQVKPEAVGEHEPP